MRGARQYTAVSLPSGSSSGASLARAAGVAAPEREVAAVVQRHRRHRVGPEQSKLVQFLEHPYQAQSSSAQTRNFVYDSYPGVRVGTTGTWLDAVAPIVVEYLPGTGIVHTTRTRRRPARSTSTTSRRWASPSTRA